MQNEFLIRIEDFSRFPGGRSKDMGPHSGEEFREKVLESALEDHNQVKIDLRNAKVVIPSFMDEAFGPIIERLGKTEFLKRVSIIPRDGSDMQFNFDETVRLRSNS
jgi:hypothetical protein